MNEKFLLFICVDFFPIFIWNEKPKKRIRLCVKKINKYGITVFSVCF